MFRFQFIFLNDGSISPLFRNPPQYHFFPRQLGIDTNRGEGGRGPPHPAGECLDHPPPPLLPIQPWGGGRYANLWTRGWRDSPSFKKSSSRDPWWFWWALLVSGHTVTATTLDREEDTQRACRLLTAYFFGNRLDKSEFGNFAGLPLNFTMTGIASKFILHLEPPS